jgi:glycosyltransferase involved in cell wall biosynthesis
VTDAGDPATPAPIGVNWLRLASSSATLSLSRSLLTASADLGRVIENLNQRIAAIDSEIPQRDVAKAEIRGLGGRSCGNEHRPPLIEWRAVLAGISQTLGPAPIVDVGIPTHGRPQYVGEAIKSVLAQTMRAWRLIVSEDGPGGGEVESAVKPYLDDRRIEYVARGEVGAARSMSLTIQDGSAPYVALLHDDDRWESNFLSRRVTFLEAHPECGFVFSGNIEIDGSGREIGRSDLRAEGVLRQQAFVPILLRNNWIATPTLLVRRTAYDAVGAAFDDRFPTIYDYEMALRLAIAFPAGYLAVRDAAYRIHGAQVSRDLQSACEHLRLLDHADYLLSDTPSLRLPGHEHRRKRSGFLLTLALDRLAECDRRAASRNLLQAIRTYPPSLVDPRLPAGLTALVLGQPATQTLMKLRRIVNRRRIRLHRRRP